MSTHVEIQTPLAPASSSSPTPPQDIFSINDIFPGDFLRTGKGTAQGFMDLAFWPNFRDKKDMMLKGTALGVMNLIKVSVLMAVIGYYGEKVVDTYKSRLLVVVPSTSLIILKDVITFVPRFGMITDLYRKTERSKWHIALTMLLGVVVFIGYVVASSVLVLSADTLIDSITNSVVLSFVMNCDSTIIKTLSIDLLLSENDRVLLAQQAELWRLGDVGWLGVSLQAWLVVIYLAIVGVQAAVLLLSVMY